MPRHDGVDAGPDLNRFHAGLAKRTRYSSMGGRASFIYAMKVTIVAGCLMGVAALLANSLQHSFGHLEEERFGNHSHFDWMCAWHGAEYIPCEICIAEKAKWKAEEERRKAESEQKKGGPAE